MHNLYKYLCYQLPTLILNIYIKSKGIILSMSALFRHMIVGCMFDQ